VELEGPEEPSEVQLVLDLKVEMEAFGRGFKVGAGAPTVIFRGGGVRVEGGAVSGRGVGVVFGPGF